jgi:type III secretion system FlhB-like substrate exporter
MIKLLVKLAIAALVANAIYRVGSEYITFIKFRDGIRDAAMFKAKTDEDLRTRIVTLASEYDIPLGDDDIAIDRENRLVTVTAEYRKPIDVLPRYAVQWPFDVSVEVQVSSAELLPGAPTPR